MLFPGATSWPPQRQANRRDILQFAGRLAVAGPFIAAGDGYAHLAAAEEIASPSLVQIDAALRDATRAKLVPGVVAMAANDGGVIYEAAFGSRQIGQQSPMSRDTIFSIASMIKLVTSVAALQLVEQGKLTLEGPVPAIDEALGAPQVLAGSTPPACQNCGRPSGRSRCATCDPYGRLHLPALGCAGPALQACNRGDAGAAARRLAALTADVRSRNALAIWDRSGLGRPYRRDGRRRAAGRVFSQPYFGAVGMADTGFAVPATQRVRQAARHYRKPDGSLVSEPPRGQTNPTVFSGGGNLYSTAPDYLTLLRALLHAGSFNGARILRAETVALMGQNQIGDIQAGLMQPADPALSNDVDFFPGMALRWGLGHMITMEPGPDGRSAGSLTWAGLLNTYYWLDPVKRVAAVFMTQVLPFADKTALALYGQFERGIYRAING